MIPGLCSSLTKEQKGKDFDIHLSCLHIMDYPFLTCHLTPLLRTPLAQRILLQPYEGLLPSVEFMKEVKGKYFPFKSLARSNCGDVSRRQSCLARRAILKLSRCLKRMPPLIFDLQRESQDHQFILLSSLFYPYKKFGRMELMALHEELGMQKNDIA